MLACQWRLCDEQNLCWRMHMPAYASERQNEARGELLYTTHCTACHTSQVHWREQKLATDCGSLVTQLRCWHSISGLNWSENEIADKANNTTFASTSACRAMRLLLTATILRMFISPCAMPSMLQNASLKIMRAKFAAISRPTSQNLRMKKIIYFRSK